MDLSKFSLENKVAVVTGCARGIGSGIAYGLAEAGADIVAIDLADLDETKEKIESLGRKFYAFNTDLSKEDEINNVWNKILATVPTIDILVNNAGMQYRHEAVDFPIDAFDKVMDVNLKAPYMLAQLSAKHFIESNKKGKIINLASLFSTFGGVNVSAYTCSKGAILSMTRALSNEWASKGICVNAIAPGYIETEITKSITEDPEKRKPMDMRIPIGRWGVPEDFAGSAVFLASSASDYITGIMLPVDGGYTVR